MQTIYSDQTGRFSKKWSKENQYIMVLCDIDRNAILVTVMKNRTSGEMICAYQELIDCLHSTGIKPKQHILDHKCSKDFKQTICKNQMTFQLVPPNNHQRNCAEKAIQTFKAHIISILCGTEKEFPLHLWCCLLPQAEDTLNMLRTARLCLTVSAYTYLWSQHDYNANPFDPLGCKVEAHVKPTVQETWAPHTAAGYYISNAKEHYRCHQVYITNTKHLRTCETIFFKHKYLTMPTITPADALIKAADNLVDTILENLPLNTTTAQGVEQLMDIFKVQAKKATCKARIARIL